MLSVCLSVLSYPFLFFFSFSSHFTFWRDAKYFPKAWNSRLNSSYLTIPRTLSTHSFLPPTRIYYILDTIHNSSRQERKKGTVHGSLQPSVFGFQKSITVRLSGWMDWMDGGRQHGRCMWNVAVVYIYGNRWLVENTTMPVSFIPPATRLKMRWDEISPFLISKATAGMRGVW